MKPPFSFCFPAFRHCFSGHDKMRRISAERQADIHEDQKQKKGRLSKQFALS